MSDNHVRNRCQDQSKAVQKKFPARIALEHLPIRVCHVDPIARTEIFRVVVGMAERGYIVPFFVPLRHRIRLFILEGCRVDDPGVLDSYRDPCRRTPNSTLDDRKPTRVDVQFTPRRNDNQTNRLAYPIRRTRDNKSCISHGNHRSSAAPVSKAPCRCVV